MKKISVIVNCFNGEKYLYKCLKSILDQKYQNFEIIFFDNFSTDKSLNIAKKIIDKRIKLFSSKKKLKLYEARNEAINNASGELIAFLDVDDWWDCNYLSSRAKVFNNYDYDIFYNNFAFFFMKKIKSIKNLKNIFYKNKKFIMNSQKITL